MKFAALYAILVGLSLLWYWGYLATRREIPELDTEPFRMIFHIAGELATAVALLAGGVGLLTNSSWGLPVHLVAMGMLLYTLIASPGYFVQRREWPMVGVFAVVFLLTLGSLVLVF
jgi:hypothetical protein